MHFFISDATNTWGDVTEWCMKGVWSKLDRIAFIMTKDTNVSFLLLIAVSWT
jgi:hypothetical protein